MSAKAWLRGMVPDAVEIHLQAFDHLFFGEPELRLMAKVCDQQRPAIDIGGNIGTYAYFLRRHASAVTAYEPNPDLASRLRRILPDIDVRQMAVSDAFGELELRIPIIDGREVHELGSIVDWDDGSEQVSRQTVGVVSIDGESFEDAGFIKIDVEQSEIPVLRGALETIKRCRPILMTEVTPLLYEDGLVETFRFVTDLEYQGWFTFENRKYTFEQFEPDLHASEDLFGTKFMNNNVFFIPREIDAQRIFSP